MAQEATANEQKKFKVPRIPGDIMIYPMIVGLLLNTFCPQVFEIGGFFTAACRGGSNTIVAAILQVHAGRHQDRHRRADSQAGRRSGSRPGRGIFL